MFSYPTVHTQAEHNVTVARAFVTGSKIHLLANPVPSQPHEGSLGALPLPLRPRITYDDTVHRRRPRGLPAPQLHCRLSHRARAQDAAEWCQPRSGDLARFTFKGVDGAMTRSPAQASLCLTKARCPSASFLVQRDTAFECATKMTKKRPGVPLRHFWCLVAPLLNVPKKQEKRPGASFFPVPGRPVSSRELPARQWPTGSSTPFHLRCLGHSRTRRPAHTATCSSARAAPARLPPRPAGPGAPCTPPKARW